MRLSLGIGLSFVKLGEATGIGPSSSLSSASSSAPSSSVPSSAPSSSVPSSAPSSSTPETLPCMVTVSGAGRTAVNGAYYRAEHQEDAEYPVVYVHSSGKFILVREADTCVWRVMDEGRYYSYYWREWLGCPGPEGMFTVPDSGWTVTGIGTAPAPEFTPAWDGCPSDPYFWPCKIVASGSGNTALNGTYCREVLLESSIWNIVYGRYNPNSGGWDTVRRYSFNNVWYMYVSSRRLAWHAASAEVPLTGWVASTSPAPTFVAYEDIDDCADCMEVDPPPSSEAPSSVPSSVPSSWPVSSASSEASSSTPSSSAPSSSVPSSSVPSSSSSTGGYDGPGWYTVKSYYYSSEDCTGEGSLQDCSAIYLASQEEADVYLACELVGGLGPETTSSDLTGPFETESEAQGGCGD